MKHHLHKSYLALLGMAVLLFAGAAGNAAAMEAPKEADARLFITELAQKAGATLQSKGNTPEQREASVHALLREGFALEFIARISLGKHWRRIKSEQRVLYTELFSQFLIRAYGARLAGFSPELFHVDSAASRGKQDMLVKTHIDQPQGPPLQASWRIRLFDGKPKIVDIVVEGVSMALNQRQEFSAVIQRDGMGGLMDMLRVRGNAGKPTLPPA